MTAHQNCDLDGLLRTWIGLNEKIQALSEKECWQLLELERRGRARPTFLLRIHSRANRLRYLRERRDIEGLKK